MGRTGRGVPRVVLQATLGRLRDAALRHYERTRSVRMATRRNANASAGPDAHNRRGGAPRGERPTSLDARRSSLRLRAYVTGPRKGAAAPERLSALRPSRCERDNKARRWEPRENDDACANAHLDRVIETV